MQVPYFSQWESADLAPELVAGTATLREDPLWRASGAVTQDEYIEWANHVCGMACLKMVLAARLGRVEPTLTLARLATRYGAYEVGPQNIRGMIYAPFVAMLSAEYGLAAEVKTALPARALPGLLDRGRLYMASVHDSIRLPDSAPPRRGGHLVLITEADGQRVVFHNPSGDSAASRADVCLPAGVFERFYAERGVLIH
ncbi:C39 family peptidase [Bordetella hinzii]|uniref:Peptidase C39-like family protein n=1 Tax=Bordetella hinzii OH87 BAL007II TaxID=1331262 RepID=A0ABR4R160_9BORD|nr:C39 family peptidase [Bordetella hinzii]KCB22980.1 peptidase C39-like family protein [Bordetella hinzii OH87 BAL007II]KCB27213.1 peptidase C39-like family protein [Bordetella hinzii CA90 BAL1384]KCB45119.1 peptidase C39-like family protein [Bordetella hinzii 4161]KCB45423.1 peptidase C39-like family protein [Bordetella hinzii 5132]KCB52028.1 peptidase C39-like family protein [Bordetella hinzii 1277]